jgi:pyruvate,water dikinase
MFPYQTRAVVQLRKDGHRQLGEMTPEDVFVLPAGDYLSQQSAMADSGSEAPISGDPISGHQDELSGVGACGGQVTASAAILTDLSECHLLGEGDVLVTRQTDPGWGPVFFLIKGLVMERGGMLSHGAILAREYGIPTVVGIKDATRKIPQGQKISVNGDRGCVQLVKE